MSSCSSYYYSTISSNDKVGRYDANNDFVQENDTVRISYCFYGEDAPVSITIENKLDEPLFVDWRRSALIINGASISYYKDVAPVQGVTASSSYGDSYKRDRRYSSIRTDSHGVFFGEMQLPRGMEFIPPKSKIESSTMKLDKQYLEDVSGETFQTETFVKGNGQKVNLKLLRFEENNSPLQVRSFLSLFTEEKNGREPDYVTFEASFYVSELIKAKRLKPSNFQAWQNKEGNFFYSSDYRGRRTGWIVAGSVILAGVIAIPIAVGASQPDLDLSF